MPRPRQVSDAQILEAARSAFIAHGPSISTVEIARMVGVTQAVLFHRFGTKEALMRQALMPPNAAPVLALLEVGPDEQELRPQLRAIALAVARHFDRYVPCWLVLRAANIDVLDGMSRHEVPAPVRSRRALSNWFHTAMEAGSIRRMDPEVLSTVFLGAFQTRSLFKHVFDPQYAGVDETRFVAQLVEMILTDSEFSLSVPMVGLTPT